MGLIVRTIARGAAGLAAAGLACLLLSGILAGATTLWPPHDIFSEFSWSVAVAVLFRLGCWMLGIVAAGCLTIMVIVGIVVAREHGHEMTSDNSDFPGSL